MKRLLITTCVLISMVALSGVTMAATDVNNIQVLANVPSMCRITSAAANIDFGNYDPTDAADDTDGASSVSFRCVKNTTYWAYITRTNTMTGPVDNLTYDLYTDVPRTVPWDSAQVGPGTTSASNAEQTIGIYGRIPALQDVGAGAYVENVTVTIEY